MDSVRSSSPLFNDSDRLELPSLAQGNLISFDPEEESRNRANVSQDRIVSTSQGIPCAQTVPESFSQGIQTSPVMEASPVQQIQDLYGSPSCEEDLTPHRVEEKVPFWKKERKVEFHTEDYTQPEFSQLDRNRFDTEETSVWKPFVVRESNTGYVDSDLGRRGSVVNVEGTRLASSMHSPCRAPPQRSVRVDRGYSDSMNVGSGTFIPSRDRFYPSRQDNPAYRSAGSGLGYRRGFSRAGYVVEDPLSDPNMAFEGQGPGGHSRDFVVQGQSPSYYCVRDRNTVGREQPVDLDPFGPGYHVDSGASAGLCNSPPVVRAQPTAGMASNPCQTDTEKLPHRKQKEPDKYDGEKVEWQDFIVHFETVATWNGWTDLEKGLQLATCLRGKAQKVLSELKPSQKSNYITLTSVLAKRFNPPHRENAFRAVLRQRRRLPKESLMDFGCEVSRLAQKAYPEFPYEALDQVSREQFVRGLSDVDMKRHVDLRNPSSLEEAISLATQFESFDLGEGHGPIAGRDETRPSRGRSAHVQAEEQLVNKKDKSTNEELASLRKQIEVLIARESKAEKASKTIAELDQKVSKLTEQVESLTKLGLAKTQSYHSGNSIPKGNCFGCGQPGHYRNACPKLKKTQSKSESEQQETSQPNARTVTRKGLWLVPGTIEGVKVEMFVDSGSDRTLVDSKFYNSIPAAARPRLSPSTWSVDTTSGSSIVAIGEAEFHLQLGNLTCSYPFVVADLGLERISVVIGLDFLEDSECLVDMGHGLLRIQDEKIPMRREFSVDDRIVEQKEQVNSDEPKIAAEIPSPGMKPRQVRAAPSLRPHLRHAPLVGNERGSVGLRPSFVLGM